MGRFEKRRKPVGPLEKRRKRLAGGGPGGSFFVGALRGVLTRRPLQAARAGKKVMGERAGGTSGWV